MRLVSYRLHEIKSTVVTQQIEVVYKDNLIHSTNLYLTKLTLTLVELTMSFVSGLAPYSSNTLIIFVKPCLLALCRAVCRDCDNE